MKGARILLDTVDGRRVAALMIDGRLEDVLIEPPEDAPPGIGAVFLARANRPMKGQGGIMLDFGNGLSGYMRRAKGIVPGEMLMVQVSSVTEPGKACPVTPEIVLKGRYGIITPFAPGVNVSRSIRDEGERDRLLEVAAESLAGRAFGLILRTAAVGIDQTTLAEELDGLCSLADQLLQARSGTAPDWLMAAPGPHEIAWQEWTDVDERDVVEGAGSFAEHGVFEAVDAALAPEVTLPGGASAVIETTRALVAIDVNTGRDTSYAAGLKANLALLQDLPRQLRVRGLGGQIVIDLAPMPKKERRRIEDAARKAFRQAGMDVVVAGWTPLGHLELQKKRDRLPLAQTWPEHGAA